jgi:GlcNAc-P-P-Und epimerase
MKVNIAVLGGAGFIGTSLIKLLIQNKYDPFIIDKNMSSTYGDRCRTADVRDLEGLCSALRGSAVIYNLAAEHADNVQPPSLYYDVNVLGARNVCEAARRNGIKKIVFTSTVAVYGFAPPNTGEDGRLEPFNEYGRTKMLAEDIYRSWAEEDPVRTCVIVRPAVVFGKNNRGNVYTMIKQMASGKFMIIGSGKNVKSMAYVENVAAFLIHCLSLGPGVHLFNYADKPDFDMNGLVKFVRSLTEKARKPVRHIPYCIGYPGGRVLDCISSLTGKKFAISGIRIKKFCATTLFDASAARKIGFVPPVGIRDGLEKTIEHEFRVPLETKTGFH